MEITLSEVSHKKNPVNFGGSLQVGAHFITGERKKIWKLIPFSFTLIIA